MNKHNINFISNKYYTNTYMLSHQNKGYKYYVTVGSRGRGKTFSGKNYLAKKFIHRNMRHWNKAYDNGERWQTVWGRLTQSAVDKVLENNGAKFFEPQILRRYKLAVKVVGDYIHFASTKKWTVNADGEREYDWYPAIWVAAINKYQHYKGNQFSEFDEIFMDELVRAKDERKSFDIPNAFKNFIENIARTRQDMRCIIYANAVEELYDLRKLFHFIPLPGKFGMYYIQTRDNNSTIIEYLDDSQEWRSTQLNTMAGLLGSDHDSAFVNMGQSLIDLDQLVYRHKMKNKQLIYKLTDGRRVYTVSSVHTGFYMIDYLEMSPYISDKSQIYTLDKSLVNSKVRFNNDIKKSMMELWNIGKFVYPDMSIARDVRSMLEHAKML